MSEAPLTLKEIRALALRNAFECPVCRSLFNSIHTGGPSAAAHNEWWVEHKPSAFFVENPSGLPCPQCGTMVWLSSEVPCPSQIVALMGIEELEENYRRGAPTWSDSVRAVARSYLA